MISNVHVCFLSGGSRLQRRRPGLHGADDLEDQGGRQGEEMTSDLMTPTPPQIEHLCSSGPGGPQ